MKSNFFQEIGRVQNDKDNYCEEKEKELNELKKRKEQDEEIIKKQDEEIRALNRRIKDKDDEIMNLKKRNSNV